MATYADGVTVAEVGDIVKCVDSFHDHAFEVGAEYTILGSYNEAITRASYVYVSGRACGWRAERFKLISRTQEPPMNEPLVDEPLVVWPEEKPRLTLGDIQPGEFFVFADVERDVVLRKLNTGSVYVHGFTVFDRHEPTCYPPERPVRRVKLTSPIQFTVI